MDETELLDEDIELDDMEDIDELDMLLPLITLELEDIEEDELEANHFLPMLKARMHAARSLPQTSLQASDGVSFLGVFLMERRETR